MRVAFSAQLSYCCKAHQGLAGLLFTWYILSRFALGHNTNTSLSPRKIIPDHNITRDIQYGGICKHSSTPWRLFTCEYVFLYIPCTWWEWTKNPPESSLGVESDSSKDGNGFENHSSFDWWESFFKFWYTHSVIDGNGFEISLCYV